MGVFNYTTQTAAVQVAGHNIEVVNSWKVGPNKAKAALTIDGVECDVNTQFAAPTPAVPSLTAENFSEALKTVEVFFAGVFKIKIAILVNGEIVYEDKLSRLDQWHVKAAAAWTEEETGRRDRSVN